MRIYRFFFTRLALQSIDLPVFILKPNPMTSRPMKYRFDNSLTWWADSSLLFDKRSKKEIEKVIETRKDSNGGQS